MKNYMLKATVFFLVAAATLAAQVTTVAKRDSATVSTSGAKARLDNTLGAVTNGFEVVLQGTAPSTVSSVIKGCMRGADQLGLTATCDTLDTYTTVANSIRKPTITVAYDYFEITDSWTGGDVTTKVSTYRVATTARNGGGGSQGGGGTWGSITGVLSDQTDLNTALGLLAPLANPTFTGTVAGITKSMVGLGNVDNTSDANKPVSSATTTALNLKEATANKDSASGYAGLTAGTLLKTAELPALAGDVTMASGQNTTVLVNMSDGVAQAGSVVVTDIVAPASPAAAHLKLFGDSTDLRFHDKNAGGTIGTTVVADAGASNNFLTGITTAGVVTKAQPSFANLSGSATVGQGGTGIGSGTSGGLPYFSSTSTIASSALLTNNAAMFGGGAGAAPKVDTAITSDAAGNESAVSYTATGSGGGAVQCTNGSAQGHATANTITLECPPTVTTSYEFALPAGAASGIMMGSNSGNVETTSWSGDAGHQASAVVIGSGSSIAATSLCSTANCPAGTYHVSVYVNITTACTTTGTYIVWLGYTDDSGARTGSSTTTFFPLQGTGSTASTGTLALASTSNYGQADFIIRSTGAATGGLGSINYGTTATACGSGGPMVGKMYINVTQVGS